MTAVKDIKKYEEMTMNYGWNANVDFLLSWGFVVPFNQKSVVEVPTALDEQDPHFEEKKKMVDGVLEHGFLFSGGFDVSYNTALSRMRFYACKDLAWIEGWVNNFYNKWEQDLMRDPDAVPELQDGMN